MIGLCYAMAAMSLSLIVVGAPWPLMAGFAAGFVFLGAAWRRITGVDRDLVDTAESLIEAEEQVEPIEENEDSYTLILANAARAHGTPYLLETYRRGVALGRPWPALLTAIELVLDEREVPLAAMAAPPREEC